MTKSLQIEISDENYQKLLEAATEKSLPLAQYVSDCLPVLLTMIDQYEEIGPLSVEDIEEIQAGIEEIERGDTVSQEETDRQINEILES